MIADTGCRRSAGPPWHAAMTKRCAKRSLKPVERSVDESFRFGEGDVNHATIVYADPIGIYGKMG
eukprot:1912016-Pyramimonas_sp.AAC.1